MTSIVARRKGHWAAPTRQGAKSLARPHSGNVSIHARLTEADLRVIHEEQRRTGQRYLSKVIEGLLVELLDATGNGRGGLRIVPTGKEIHSRHYRIHPHVLDRVKKLSGQVGFNDQQIIRAAIARVARRMA